MELALAASMMLMGVAIAAVWTRDIVSGKVDLSGGVFAARDPNGGTLFWPHWVAEYATASALVVAGFAVLADASWSESAAAAALGALLYTSTNSLGWAFAAPERRPYAAPMLAGVAIGVLGMVYLVMQ